MKSNNFACLSRRAFISGLGAATVGSGVGVSTTSDSKDSKSQYRIGLPLEKQWEFGFVNDDGFAGGTISMGTVTDDTIYLTLGGTDRETSKLVALDRSNHDRRWESTTDKEVAAPSVIDERLFVTGGSELLAFSATEQPNEPIWRKQVNFDATTAQMTFGSSVCFAAYNIEVEEGDGEPQYHLRDGGIFAFSQNGEPRWQDQGMMMDTPYYHNNTLYHTAEHRYWQDDQLYTVSGRVVARNPKTGRVKWRTPDFKLYRMQPASSLDLLLAASPDGALHAIDMESGDWLWKVHLGQTIGDFTNGPERIFAASGRQLTALNAENQEPVWSRNDLGSLFDLSYNGGLLFIGTFNAEFYALDVTTGEKVWKGSLREESILQGPGYDHIHDGILYIVGGNWMASFAGQRGQALQALERARSESALGSVALPIANLLGRKRALKRAEQAIEEQRYDVARAAIDTVTFRQGVVEASLATITGGSLYTGGRYATRKRRANKLRSQLDDLRAVYPIDSGILKGQEPTTLIQQGEVAVESLNRSRFGVPITSGWRNDDYADIEAKIGHAIGLKSELADLSRGLADLDDPSVIQAWRKNFNTRLKSAEFDDIKTSIQRCRIALNLTERYNAHIRDETDAAIDISGLQSLLTKVQNPTESVAEGAFNYCQATIEVLDTYDGTISVLVSYDLQPIQNAIQKALEPSTRKWNGATANHKELSELLEIAASAETKRTDLNLEYSDLQSQEVVQWIQSSLYEQSTEKLKQVHKLLKNLKSGIWQTTHLFAYSPIEFEHLVAELYSDRGYHVKVTQQSNDGGIDVIAHGKEGRLVIQVKQFSEGNRVGRPTVQQTAGTRDLFDADRAVIVTSSEFTNTAREAAIKYGASVELINGTDLVQQLSRSSFAPPTGQGADSKQYHKHRQQRSRTRSSRTSNRSSNTNSESQKATFCMACHKLYKGGLYEIQTSDGRTIRCCARCKQLLEESPDIMDANREESCNILNVESGASRQKIKNAYRERAQEVHPDQGGGHDAFIRVQKAYDLLYEEAE